MKNNARWDFLRYSGDTKAANGSTFFKIIVGRNGKPEKCVVLLSTRNAALDKAVCIHAMKFRFKSARNEKGQPAYAVAETMVNFVVKRGATIFNSQPDYVVRLKFLPKGVARNPYFHVTVSVDKEGKLKACDPGPPISDRQELNDVLTQMQNLSCGQLFTLWDPLVETNLANEHIAYVRTIRVGFDESEQAPQPAQ